MNKTKITALLLSVVMLAGIISGCSKSFNVTADKFVKACEKLGLEEYVDTQMQYPDLSDAENGFYIMTDDEDEIGDLTGDSFTDLLNLMDLNDDIGADDISSIAAAVKCTSLDDITGKDSLADMKFNGALALQITLKNENLAKDIIDGADDVLGIGGIMTKHLSGKEYYCSGKEGYIRLHVDIAELIKVFLNDDTAVKQFKNNFGWDPEEFFDGVKGDIAVSIDVRGANVFVLLGCALNTKPVVYEDFLKAFFLTNDPMKIPDNNKLYQDLADLLPSLLKLFIKDTGESGSCGTIPKGNGQKVGISLPTKDLKRWDQDGENMRKGLKAKGYSVDLQYAENDVSKQISQIDNMINSGCKVLIIAAIDSPSLINVLEKAHQKNIPVIAYDNLIMESEYVDYYVTFDSYMTGVLQAEYIINKLDLKNSKGPFTIEFTAGEPGDFNAVYYYTGARDALYSYIHNGRLKVVSGMDDFTLAATDGWMTDKAQARAEDIITRFYSNGTQIDAWLCANDSTALGVANALEAKYTGKYPIITGQDCEIANVKNIINGKQSMSVFRDTRTLASRAVLMADQIISGQDVETNDTVTFDNGKKVVPAYLCVPVVVTADNYKEILIDSGYYAADQLA